MPTVLVIEDNAAVRDYVIDTLEMAGFKTAGAADGMVGLQLARGQLPDLVVCDISMPNLDGYRVLEELRAEPDTATIPFVFLTANRAREDMRQGMELGADDYIPKPFRAAELLRAVNTQLEKQATIARQHDSTMTILRKNILYALPHELRTPLQSVIGFSQMIMMAAEDGLDPGQAVEWAEMILAGGERLHRLIENYLVYAQIALIESDPEQIEALRNHLVADSANIITVKALQQAEQVNRSGDLQLDLCDQALRISEDSLSKLVGELVSNAFKFSDSDTLVVVRSYREGNCFVLAVSDDGRGMTERQIRNIGAYMQFERALYEQQGLGLGLVIAKRLVDLYGGNLHISSDHQHGTLITVNFPLY